MLKSLAVALFTSERMKTTETRAKEVRSLVDKVITWARRGDVHPPSGHRGSRRQGSRRQGLDDRDRYEDRPGGYTRIEGGPAQGQTPLRWSSWSSSTSVGRTEPPAVPCEGLPARPSSCPELALTHLPRRTQHLVIRFSDIHYAYRAGETLTPALRGVSLVAHEGEHVAVLGANGSGKSTLVQMVNGLLVPESGSVDVDGIDTRDETRWLELRQRVGVVFQHPDDQIVATSVEDDVDSAPRIWACRGTRCASGSMRRFPRSGSPVWNAENRIVLSGGQKQRLVMAGALAMHPAYLVLDEPASMLDPVGTC